jgi:Zn-dependent protease with chaperone function
MFFSDFRNKLSVSLALLKNKKTWTYLFYGLIIIVAEISIGTFLSKITLPEIISKIFYVILIAFGIILAYRFLLFVFKDISNRIKDLRILSKIPAEKEVTWSMLCQTAELFQTDKGQSRYFELIRMNKINIVDYFPTSKLPKLQGKSGEEQLARLREQILGLQECIR